MKSSSCNIDGVKLVGTDCHCDSRGLFYRAFCIEELAHIVVDRKIRQINISRTTAKGTVRGMHYQMGQHSEMKFVRCIKGRIWDVAVDLRKNSKTYLQWHGVHLSEENRRMLVIPEGCAHGFQALEDGSELLYLHTADYLPEFEAGLRFDDPHLSISWPLPVGDISERDLSYPYISSSGIGGVV